MGVPWLTSGSLGSRTALARIFAACGFCGHSAEGVCGGLVYITHADTAFVQAAKTLAMCHPTVQPALERDLQPYEKLRPVEANEVSGDS